jgi:hypothetical protein
MIDDILATSGVTRRQYNQHKSAFLRRILCIAYLQSENAITTGQALSYRLEAARNQYEREIAND